MTPPEMVRASTSSRASRSLPNQYSASGRSRRLTKAIASAAERVPSTGSTGPKISSRIGAIQLLRCLAACRISENTSMISAMVVSTAERWPKSAEIAWRKRSSWSATTLRSRASRSRRAARSGAGSSRDRATMARKACSRARSGVLAGDRSMVGSKVRSMPLIPEMASAPKVSLPQAGPLRNFWQERAKQT